MKHIIVLLTVMIFFVSCSKEKNEDQIKNEIFEHKEQIKLLEQELKNTSNGNDIKKLKVKVLTIEKQKTVHTFTATGTVKAENMAFISPEMNGQIKHIYVKEGQFVKKGQLLIALNSNIVSSQIKELKTRLELADIMFEKQKSLWDQKIGKETDYLQAKNQKESLEANLETMNAQLSMSLIKAPFDGIVDYIYVKEGEMGIPGRQVIDLVNLSAMEIEAEISERYLPVIRKGDSVTVSFPTYPGFEIKTTISRTGNIINTGNRTFKINVKFSNKDSKIKPNMLAELLLSDYQGESISIPSAVIKTDIYGNYVYVINDDQGNKTAEKRYVKTGLHSRENTIIEDGLKPGDAVITAGFNLVENGSHVQIVN